MEVEVQVEVQVQVTCNMEETVKPYGETKFIKRMKKQQTANRDRNRNKKRRKRQRDSDTPTYLGTYIFSESKKAGAEGWGRSSGERCRARHVSFHSLFCQYFQFVWGYHTCTRYRRSLWYAGHSEYEHTACYFGREGGVWEPCTSEAGTIARDARRRGASDRVLTCGSGFMQCTSPPVRALCTSYTLHNLCNAFIA